MTVLSDQEYQDLSPHIEAIKRTVTCGMEVSRQPRNVCVKIFNRINPEQRICLTCSGDIDRMYQRINEYINQYERETRR